MHDNYLNIIYYRITTAILKETQVNFELLNGISG